MGRLGKWSSDRIEWLNGTLPTMGRRTATVKYMVQIQHTKTNALGVAQAINVGGATSGITRIWGMIAFAPDATSMGGTVAGVRGFATIRYGWAGQTVTIPVNAVASASRVNLLIWGR